jgi:AraC-like DNA-binding protein
VRKLLSSTFVSSETLRVSTNSRLSILCPRYLSGFVLSGPAILLAQGFYVKNHMKGKSIVLHCIKRASEACVGQLRFNPRAVDLGLPELSPQQARAAGAQTLAVDRVSEATGYTHPTSFTAAFRRHFGLRPIDLKASGATSRRG